MWESHTIEDYEWQGHSQLKKYSFHQSKIPVMAELDISRATVFRDYAKFYDMQNFCKKQTICLMGRCIYKSYGI